METLDSTTIGYNSLLVNYETNDEYIKTVDLSIVKQENVAYNRSPVANDQHFFYHSSQHHQLNNTTDVLSTSINYENSSPQMPPTPPSPLNQTIENYSNNQLPRQLDYSIINSTSQTKRDLVTKNKRKNSNLKPYSLCHINGVHDQLTRQQIRASNSVAKRNERERKRVKNVNLGFQKLRNHIPNNAKKMSKVETLRSAVKYIRQLQEILNETGQSNHTTELLLNILNSNQYECSSSSSSIQTSSNLETCNSNSTLDYFDITELLS